MTVLMKACADCGESKPPTAFSVKDRRRGYLAKYCKPCDSARAVARQAGKTAERVAYNRRWRAANPEKVKEYNRRGGARYRESHPDYWRDYYLANRERRILNAREWRDRNRDYYLTAEAGRRLRKKFGLRPDELLALVDAAVPKSLPPAMREDACQELALLVLTGEVAAADIQTAAKQVVKGLWGMHGLRFKTVSLDAPIGRDGASTFAESLIG